MSTVHSSPFLGSLTIDQVMQFIDHIQPLLKACGVEQYCKQCGKKVYWFRCLDGMALPIDVYGTNHELTCPKANVWRKKKESK